MRVYNIKGERITGVFQFDYKGYIVSVESNSSGNVKIIVEHNTQNLGDNCYMYDDSGDITKTLESVLQWIDEDIQWDEDVNLLENIKLEEENGT